MQMRFRLDNVQILLIILIALAALTLFFSLAFGTYLKISPYAGTIALLLFGGFCIYTGYSSKRRKEPEERNIFWYPINFIRTGVLVIFLTLLYSIIKIFFR